MRLWGLLLAAGLMSMLGRVGCTRGDASEKQGKIGAGLADRGFESLAGSDEVLQAVRTAEVGGRRVYYLQPQVDRLQPHEGRERRFIARAAAKAPPVSGDAAASAAPVNGLSAKDARELERINRLRAQARHNWNRVQALAGESAPAEGDDFQPSGPVEITAFALVSVAGSLLVFISIGFPTAFT